MTMKKKSVVNLLVLIVFPLIIIWSMPEGANSAQPSEPSTKKMTYSVVIGTSSVGSSGYTQGVGIANLISKKAPGISATARPVGGSDANVRAVRDGKVEMAIVNAVSAVQGFLGTGAYSKEGKASLRLLLQGFLTPRFIVTRKASRIEKLEDLQGKTIIGKRPAMADIEAAFLAYLEIAGISKEKVKIVETVETGETIEALKIGSVDAALLPTTFLSPGFQELSRTTEVVVPSLTQDQAKKMIERLGPAFRPMKVPLGTFKGQEKEILTIATPMILMARDDLSQDAVYMVVKTLIDNEKDVKALHSEAQYWTLENTLESPPLPFHDGVVKLLKEKGVWTPNLDAWQKKH
jgi:TRAP transporter TAXI family solute receptor